ncbi:putative 2-hydroxyacid dehydrogenase [Pseudodesulfovibrio hydrargyri]|uniref:Putative 2-hydroxyacid dehydrogenase n=1 Tax=Pseudodesulfovibrio hydrargyri TaxID=2125990 RepID=A0A1J5NBY3_9BACT|nr:D-glycerate dehydrogenase [Pseudodesulfovibrio hydrargyri]OIQ50727.1 putative 2-hydroxyacid dehydrogenase [Pseudodesulfovibrio hydrargyri]
MNLPKVYVTRQIPKQGLDLLRQAAEVEVNPDDAPVPRERLLEIIKDCQGVIGLLTERIDAEFFDAAPNLKGYANYAVGFDNIDVPEATRRGLPVTNTPDVLTNATAECAWSLLFGVARRVVEADAVMRSGSWAGWGPMQFIGGDVTGKTLGIVGAGRIGTAMARMSRGFDMPVLYTSSSGRRNETLDKELNARLVSFEELLEESDFISLHAPLNPGTRHLFGADAFKRMKRTAYIINTARGPVIDEQALLEALKAGEIAGAGLDVYENEPALTPGLAELANVVLLPHIGSGTESSRTDMSMLAARNMLAMLKGHKPETCLNPEIYD